MLNNVKCKEGCLFFYNTIENGLNRKYPTVSTSKV